MATKFIDEAKIFVKAGDGGRGCVSYESVHGSPHKRKASGGNGGKGGSIVIEVDPQLATLMDFKFKQHYSADNGGHGLGKNQFGKNGQDLVIKVPRGTVIHPQESNENLVVDGSVELVNPSDRVIFMVGGEGGKGNALMTKAELRDEQEFSEPRRVEGVWINLELKLVADVGLVGLPNAGKSSLIRAVSGAKPKVANYPFTTLAPNLGVVTEPDSPLQRTLVFADIPGLIEGAHKGVGLGNRFLRHIERVATIVMVVDASEGAEAARQAYETVRKELLLKDGALIKRVGVLLLNKCDLISDEEQQVVKDAFSDIEGDLKIYCVSATSALGLEEAVKGIFSRVI